MTGVNQTTTASLPSPTQIEAARAAVRDEVGGLLCHQGVCTAEFNSVCRCESAARAVLRAIGFSSQPGAEVWLRPNCYGGLYVTEFTDEPDAIRYVRAGLPGQETANG